MTEEDGKGGKMPRLTIMEEVLLLGLKDKQVRPAPFLLLPSVPFVEPSFVAEWRRSVPAAVSMHCASTVRPFRPFCSDESLVLLRDTFRSGMITYHMLYEGAFS